MRGWIILFLLLALGVGLYAWQRDVRSVKQLGEAVKTDIRRLTPGRPEVVEQAPAAPAAYAGRRRRHYY